ncbi:MAG: hypothetical protein FJZ01_13455 [Candidatus Sericytochromatia bacterium]|nr:hypothetical protein [Candidatus Tanganyikabacteria bacterium]
MNRLDVAPFTKDGFEMFVVDSGADRVTVKFRGTIEHPAPGEFLDPLLDSIHTKAVAVRVSNVDADFSGLDFLNSSGIKAILKWVMRSTETNLGTNPSYQLRLLYSSRVTWQQASLKAITFLTKGTVVAEPILGADAAER